MKFQTRFMLVTLICLGLLCTTAFTAFAKEGPQYGGILKIAMKGSADTLDPHVTGARRAYTIIMNVFDTLVYKDIDNTYKPGLATGWSWNTSGTVFTFKLREGVKFHDGTPFDAEAVVYNLNRMVDPKTKSKFAAEAIGPYETSRALDEVTVEAKFSKPIAPTALLDSLSQAYLSMVSPTAAEKWGPDDFGRHPVGTGPFIFKEWTAQDRVTVVRNDDYEWASPVFKHSGRAFLEQIVFLTIPEDSTRAATLETGESDIVLELSEEGVQRLQSAKDFQVVFGDVPGCPVIFWMNVEHPILSDIRVRRAMLYGFDSPLLAKTTYQGLVTPIYGPLGPTTWAYNPAVEKMYGYDPEKAGALLDEAGWVMNKRTGIREKDGKPLKFDLSDLFDNRRGEFFQGQMREIGIAVDARIVTSDILWQITRKGDTYAMASTWFAYSDPDVLRLLYHSSNVGTGFAISRYKDDALDEMLMDALGEPDGDRRKQLYFKIQEEIMSQALIVPVYARRQHDGLKANIEGYRLDRGQYPVLFDVSLK